MVSHKLRLRFITLLKYVKCHLEYQQMYLWGSSVGSRIIMSSFLLYSAQFGLSVCLSVGFGSVAEGGGCGGSPSGRARSRGQLGGWGGEEGIQGMKSSEGETYFVVFEAVCVN